MKCPKCGYSFENGNKDKFPIEPAGACPKCGKTWYYMKDLQTEEYFCPNCRHSQLIQSFGRR